MLGIHPHVKDTTTRKMLVEAKAANNADAEEQVFVGFSIPSYERERTASAVTQTVEGGAAGLKNNGAP